MFTDIVGYTRLMGQSEQKAFEVLQQNRAVQKPLIEQFNGTFIKELGDGTMASFSKSTDAVRCAMAIQKASAEHPDLNLRIGIHLGEVVFEDGDVFGDGVNIAARIESAGKVGTVYISGAVHGTVHNKDDIQTRFIEQMQLKNVNRPIDIYEVAVDGKFSEGSPAERKKIKPSGLAKPVGVGVAVLALLLLMLWFFMGSDGATDKQIDHASIAVLPFENMSPDPENEFFCDGVTEDILTHLSKLKNLKVISRTSVMKFKETQLSIPEIAKELDVEYIVEGSVRKHNDDVIITAQLIHAGSDGHLWADNFQRKLDDVFAVQSEVAQEIVKSLNLKISLEEKEGLRSFATENVRAYELYLQGRQLANDRSEDGLLKAQDLFNEVVALDPLYVEAYGEMANASVHLHNYHGYPKDSCFAAADRSLEVALNIDSSNYRVQTALGTIETNRRNYSEAEKAFQKALKDNPNDATAFHQYGYLLHRMGRSEEGLEMIYKALELDPYSEIINRNVVYRLDNLGRYEDALKFAEQNASLLGDSREYLSVLIDLYNSLGKWDKGLNIVYQYDSLYPEWIGDDSRHFNTKFHFEHDEEKLLSELDFALKNNPRVWRSASYRYINMNLQFGNFEEAKRFMNSEEYLLKTDSIWQLWNNCTFAYYTGEYESAEELYAELRPNYSNRYYCWIKMGREAEVRDTLMNSKALGNYERSFLYAGLGEVDSALHYFEQVDGWSEVAHARFDKDMKPLWNEPRFKAKVAEYNFPALDEE